VRFKTLADAKRAALRSGATLEIDGVKFNSSGEQHQIERKRPQPKQPEPTAKPEQAPAPGKDHTADIESLRNTNSQLVTAMRSLIAKVEEQDAEIRRFRDKPEPAPVVQQKEQQPVEWEFSISHNEDGLAKKIVAKPVAAKQPATLSERAVGILEKSNKG
jgi:hypothetical protein